MEINIKNAFKEAVKFSCGPCIEKYHTLTEINQKLCLQLIQYLLKRPLLTTILFSVFSIIVIFVLAAAFITLIGVFIIAVIILLFEGLIFIAIVTAISMSIATITLIVMIIGGVKYKLTIIHDLD